MYSSVPPKEGTKGTQPHAIASSPVFRCIDELQEKLGQLREGHDPIVFGAAQGAHFVIAIVTIDDPGKGGPGQEVHELSEQGLAGVHRSLRESGPRKRARNGIPCSSRHHPFSCLTH